MKFNKIKRSFVIVTILIATINMVGCSYSFTGASVPPHLKTIYLNLASDRSGSGEPGLSDNFTNELTLKFLNDNTLQVADGANADARLECTITSLNDSPQVLGVDSDQIQTRRITINVKVVYRDLIKKKNIFDKNFSNYGDYDDNSDDVQTEREKAITDAIDRITEDILLGVVSNW